MTFRKTLPPLVALATLAACAAPMPQDDTAADRLDMLDCKAADYQDLVGQTSPQISIPAGTAYRQYRTGDPVTMDFAPARLNFEYDRAGVLVKVSCG